MSCSDVGGWQCMQVGQDVVALFLAGFMASLGAGNAVASTKAWIGRQLPNEAFTSAAFSATASG